MAWNENDLAYLAGIIDGEGCIYIERFKGNKRAKNVLHILRLRVSMTDDIVTPWIFQQFGGNFYVRDNRGKWLRHRTEKIWQVNSDKAGEILRLVLPYLKIKKKRAEIALEFLEYKGASRGRGGRFNPIPLNVVENREKFFAEVRAEIRR